MTVAANLAPPARRPVGILARAILQKVWAVRLRRSGFRDLEPVRDRDAPLSCAGAPSHLHDVLNPAAQARQHGFDTFMPGAPTLIPHRQSLAVAVHLTAEYYRRLEHLAQRFDDAGDHDIAVAISDGWPVRRIKAELGVGQHRIERVAKQLRIWMSEPREDDDSDG